LTVKKLNNKFAVTNMKNIIKSASIFLLLSCSTGSQPINYGKDNCDFCKMTIMDQKFGTEIVTKKGKIYKFDSDECMRNFYNKNISEIVTFEYIYVADYANPGGLSNGKLAFYLHGPKVKSPMGGNLAAFSKKVDAEDFQKKLGGEILTFDQMLLTE